MAQPNLGQPAFSFSQLEYATQYHNNYNHYVTAGVITTLYPENHHGLQLL